MSSIDQRVVEMRFDNRQFESGIQSSLSALDKLKAGLNLAESSKNLSELAATGRGFSLDHLSKSIDTIASRFTSLGVIGVTALANIANQAVNTGKQIVASLTTDPITTGFSEYELKMGAIQTIMVGTGESLETVNQYLEELNAYSDRTIYSFSDMTQNIGKFTNAGVKLKDAVKAIQGVANVAALSGANANEASRAMYNFAQALSAGYVKFIDWKSIEMANMATVGFKTELLNAAAAMGTLKKNSDGTFTTLSGATITAIKGFNESLGEAWMTSDVLVKTLGKYTDENTDLGKSAMDAAQSVKTLSQLMSTLKEAAQSGWAATWEIIAGDFNEAKILFTEINSVMSGIIGGSAFARNQMLQGWKDLGGRTALIDGVRNALIGIADVIKPVASAFKDIFPSTTAAQLMAFTTSFKDLTAKFKMGETTAANLKRTFKGLFAIFDIIGMGISAAAKAFGKFIEFMLPAGDGILSITGSLGDFVLGIRDTLKTTDIFNKLLEELGKFLAPIAEWAKIAGAGIVDLVLSFTDSLMPAKDFIAAIKETFESFKKFNTSSAKEFSQKLSDSFTPLVGIGDKVKEVFGKLSQKIQKVMPEFKNVISSLARGFQTLKEKIKEMLGNFDSSSVVTMINGGIFALILLTVKKMFSNLTKLFAENSPVYQKVIEVLDGVKGALKAWQTSLKADTLMKIAGAIALLTVSVVALSMIDKEKLSSALAAITIMFADLFGGLAIFGKFANGKDITAMSKIAFAMVALGVALLFFAGAVTKLAKLDWEQLAKGLAGVGALTAMLVAASKEFESGGKDMLVGAIGLVVFASAVQKLSKILITISELDPMKMINGLVILSGLMAEVALFMRYGEIGAIDAKTGAGFLLFAFGISILANAIGKLGGLDPKVLIIGLSTLAGILGLLGLFANALTVEGAIVQTAVGFLIISGAIWILASSLKKLGEVDPLVLTRGLLAMAYALLIVALATNAMKSAIPGALALTIMAVALGMLVPTLIILGNLPWQVIGMGLLALAGVFVVFAAGGFLMGLVAIPLMIGAAAITLFGIAATLAGAGILAFATGLSILAAIGIPAAGALNLVFTAFANAIVAFIVTIGDAAVPIADAFEKVMMAIFGTIRKNAPTIVEMVMNTLVLILSTIARTLPRIIELAVEIVVSFITGLNNGMKDIVDAAFKLFISFINALADAIRTNGKSIWDAAVKLVNAICYAIADVLGLGGLYDEGVASMNEFLGGIGSMLAGIWTAAVGIGTKVIEGIKNGLKGIWDTMVNVGKEILEGLLEGVKNIGKNLGKTLMDNVGKGIDDLKNFLGIKSPSRVAMGIGEYFSEGLVIGISNLGKDVAESAKDLGATAVDNISKSISKISSALEADTDFNPVITPVFDMTNIDSGIDSMDKRLADPKKILLAGANASAGAISTQMNASTSGEVSAITQPQGATMVFTQNNYSPKALSRLEIYRQTKNQFSAMKGVVQTV